MSSLGIPIPLPVVAPPVAQAMERALKVAVPFLKLNPIGKTAITAGTGVWHLGKEIVDFSKVWRHGTLSSLGSTALRTGLAISQVAGAIFQHTLFNTIVLSASVVKDLVSLIRAHAAKDDWAIGNACWALTGSLLFMTMAVYGAPEIVLAGLVFSVFSEVAKSVGELKKGNWLEGIASLILAAIFSYQAGASYQQVRLRWMALKILKIEVPKDLEVAEKFKPLVGRIKKGTEGEFLNEHSLSNLDKVIADNGVRHQLSRFGCADLGAHVSHLGGGAVKGSVITLRQREVGMRERLPEYELMFNLNHVHRDRLQTTLSELENLPKGELESLMLKMDICEGDLSIKTEPYRYPTGKVFGEAHTVTCKGVGSVSVGASKEMINLYDRVVVKVDESHDAKSMHFLLSLVGLDGALKPSTSEDLERLKIGKLFRAHYPREATPFERSDAFFDLPLPDLKSAIVKRVPDMQTRLEQDLSRIVPEEISPGKIVYNLPDLAQKARDLGAKVLMSGLGCSNYIERAVSIMLTGALSSQGRFDAGLGIKGISSSFDHKTGGADAIFTRVVMDNKRANIPIADLPFAGRLQMLYSLNVLNRGSYQYHSDNFGTRQISDPSYLRRPNLVEFMNREASHWSEHNEVMVKDISPKDVIGCVVESASDKTTLVNAFLSAGVAKSVEGKVYVRNVPADDFIHIGPYVASKSLSHSP